MQAAHLTALCSVQLRSVVSGGARQGKHETTDWDHVITNCNVGDALANGLDDAAAFVTEDASPNCKQ